MANHTHQARLYSMGLMAIIRQTYSFDDNGCCTDFGKFEGCYEATIYLHELGCNGDDGEGLISFPDGSSECAYKVTPEERAMMAGPWDQEGNVFVKHGWLYLVCEGSDGGVIGSHVGEPQWAERLAGQDAEEEV